MNTLEKFGDLLGKTLTNVVNVADKQLVFTLDTGEKYQLYHSQNCCEDVSIEDINGDLLDLVGAPLLMVDEAIHNGETPEGAELPKWNESYTWTFYRMATVKGYVTIRWLGQSNGYYSETVDFGPAY